MNFRLNRTDLRQMWFDLENGRPGDCTFMLDDGSTIEMHLYVMEFISPQLFALVTAMGSALRSSIFVRLRYIGRGNFLKLRRYIYAGMVAVLGHELFSLLMDGMMLNVFNLNVMDQALQYLGSCALFFLVYTNENHETIVIPSTFLGNTAQQWDLAYEYIMAGLYTGTGHGFFGMDGSMPHQAPPQTRGSENVNTMETDTAMHGTNVIYISDSSSEDSEHSDDCDTRTMSTTVEVSDDEEPTAESTSSSSNSAAYQSAKASPIGNDSASLQDLETEPISSNEESSTFRSEHVATPIDDGEHDGDMTIPSDTGSQSSLYSDVSTDESQDQQEDPADMPTGTGKKEEEQRDTKDSDTDTDDDDEDQTQHSNEDIMYARRSLPLPFIQDMPSYSDNGEEMLSNISDNTDDDL